MLSLSRLQLESTYRTGENDAVRGFYQPCLDQASLYDRAVGYFRSSVFLVIGRPFLEFFKRGGRMRLVCSPELSESDHQAIAEGYSSREVVVVGALNREIQDLMEKPEVQQQARALATLIKIGVLDIKLAYTVSKTGIFHEKLGVFTDSLGNQVTFKGSVNETWRAWHPDGNFESFEVFCSWLANDQLRVTNHNSYFQRLWNGEVSTLETLDFPEASRKRLISFARDDLDQVYNSYGESPATPLNLAAKPDPQIESIAKDHISEEEGTVFKRKRIDELFPHQVAALETWRGAASRGILKHATGSGKTITAIAALREHGKSGGVGLVLVPSRLLLRQWQQEIKREIPDAYTLLAGDGNTNWKDGRLAQLCMADGGDSVRIVLSTLQTANTNEFIRMVTRSTTNLLLVADEVHQIGSRENSRLLEINAAKRLGLSATPERYGDPEGTAKILTYFCGVLEPPFTLSDAIKSGRLVQYEYHPTAVHLTLEESEQWIKLSKEIAAEIARASSREKALAINERARNLLIKRARIAKKARAKISYAAKVIEQFRSGQRWLIYCEDAEQLTEIRETCRAKGVESLEYHTGMRGSKGANLDWFKRHGGVLVSIRCLDEGVDIPEVSHAVILASSRNPRQFIQRRGRVLRKAEWKEQATIYDVLVVPVAVEVEPEQVSLLKSELSRAIEFANGAINRAAGAELRKVALELGLEIEKLAQLGVEEDGEGKHEQ
jgi:superfamily II DNA or RNA helicase